MIFIHIECIPHNISIKIMSSKTTSQSNNVTMKYTDIDPSLIWVEDVKMGKESVPLIRYGPGKNTLCVQGPWIKMSQYGIPPGEYLNNGAKNEYYNEEARDSMKFPLDVRCAVQTDLEDESKTNSSEIKAFIEKLKAIDEHIKKSSQIISASGIEEDNIMRYKPICRKPAPPKKKVVGVEPKEKFYYMKTKLATNFANKKEIITEFYDIDRTTNKVLNQVTTGDSKHITLEDLEKFITFNCEQLPIIQFVKVWIQSTGDWGITLKLKKCRVKKSIKTSAVNTEFLESDEEAEMKPIKATKEASVKEASAKAPAKSTKGVATVDSASDNDESDDDTVPAIPVVAAKGKPTPKKVEPEPSDDDSEDEDSSSESEEVKPPPKVTKAPVKGPVKGKVNKVSA